MNKFYLSFICWVFLVNLCAFDKVSYFFKNTKWQSTDFVWNLGIAQASSTIHSFKPEKYFYQRDRKCIIPYLSLNNSIIWLNPDMLRKFYLEDLNKIKNPFVLVICDGDNTFPNEVGLSIDQLNSLIYNQKIKHIFAQNNVITHKKISSIPIGIDFHTFAYKNGKKVSPNAQEKILKTIIENSKPIENRIDRIFVDFQHNDNIRNGGYKRYLEFNEDRKMIFEQLFETNLIDYSKKPLERSKLWELKSNYSFTVSPHGNGLDCHRTWEDLALGCIVIVKSSPIDNLYENLPVVIVRDWNEITEENLKVWKEKFSPMIKDGSYYQKLKNDYWIVKIRNKANEI